MCWWVASRHQEPEGDLDMSCFSFDLSDTITPGGEAGHEEAVVKAGLVKALGFRSDSGKEVEAADQFVVFQLNHEMEGNTVAESADVAPAIEGSTEDPDVLVSLRMLSFQVGQQEDVDRDTRATMRLTFGKDENSTDKFFDNVFWSIAAGLDLYNQATGEKTPGKDLKCDFGKAFANRPIEIPGGLGVLQFEVVKHKEPKWWRKIFSFLGSGTGKSLVSVLGFPAITTQAIDMLNEMLSRFLEDATPEALFKSKPMRLALSQYAKDEFTGGNARVRLGALRPGFCVMTRGRDVDAFNEENLVFYPTHGILAPDDALADDVASGEYEDPLEDVTYAVFRVGMKSTKLDPTFNFRA